MSRRLDTLLLDAKTALNAQGVIGVADMANLSEIAFYVDFDHTSAAGVVLIETASSETYAGTWAVLSTVTWAAIDKAHYVAVTGVFRAVRARISSAVTSGTVSVRAVGNFI